MRGDGLENREWLLQSRHDEFRERSDSVIEADLRIGIVLRLREEFR